LQQLQGLLPAADVDPGETSQRSTVSVESQSENHLTLGQNMSKWGTPIINLQATEKNRRKSSNFRGPFFHSHHQWVRNHGNGMMREIIPGATFRPMKTGSSAWFLHHEIHWVFIPLS